MIFQFSPPLIGIPFLQGFINFVRSINSKLILMIVSILIVAACSPQPSESNLDPGHKVPATTILSEYRGFRLTQGAWLDQRRIVQFPYALLVDEHSLSAHHQKLTELEAQLVANSENLEFQQEESIELLLNAEMQRFIGFLLVMERFPHRFTITTELFLDAEMFIKEQAKNDFIAEEKLNSFNRWLLSQLHALQSGQGQKISLSKYQVDEARRRLSNVAQMLKNSPSSSTPIREIKQAIRALEQEIGLQKETSRVLPGMWALPNGMDWYQTQFAFRTQTEQTSEFLYNQGMKLKNIERLANEQIIEGKNVDAWLSLLGLHQPQLEGCAVEVEGERWTPRALYRLMSAPCFSASVIATLDINSAAERSLFDLVQSDNVMPLLLVQSGRSDSAELKQFKAWVMQSELALATAELGVHKYKWSLAFAKQFLLQRSLLAEASIEEKLFNLVMEPGRVSANIARYYELQALLDEGFLPKNISPEQRRLLLKTPASQWRNRLAVSNE